MKTDDINGVGGPVPKAAFPWVRTGLAAVLGIALVALLYTQGQFIRKPYVIALLWLLPTLILLGMVVRRHDRPRVLRLGPMAPLLALTATMLLYLCSSVTRHRWFYFTRWTPSAEFPYYSNWLLLVLLTALFIPLFTLRFRRIWRLPLAILLLSQGACFWELMHTTGGAALYRIDHPSFMFRLHEVASCFPHLVNYNPYWGAGTPHAVSVTSGAIAPGLVLMPLLKVFPVHQVYTLGIGLIFIVLVPWIAAMSVRGMGGDRSAACIAGVLALRISQHFFLWMLHYGTIGAALASSMILPVSALTFRVVMLGKTGWRTGAALVLALFFFLLWPLDAIFGVAMAGSLLLNGRHWSRRKLGFLAVCGAVLLLLIGRMILVLFNEGSGAVDHVMQRGTHESGWLAWLTVKSFRAGGAHLLDHLREGHPLLLFFGLAGVWVAAPKLVRNWFLPIVVFLCLVTGWGAQWKPHSQLSRASIPLFFVCIAPAAILASRLLRFGDDRVAPARAFLAALLIVTGFNAVKVYGNESLAPYAVMDGPTRQLVAWIREHTPEGGRVMFAGRCVHGYGGGNVAYLPILTGREMMADDYYGFPPGTIEYEYPPLAIRKSSAKMQLFLDAYNITHIVSYHPKWHDYFMSYPDRFEEQFAVPAHDYVIRVYAVKRTPATLVQGRGQARARFNRIDVTLADDAKEVILSYNWMDGLRVTPPVEIFPCPLTEGVTLIGARPNGQREFQVTYR